MAVGAFVSCALLERSEPEVTLPMLESKAVAHALAPAAAPEPVPAIVPGAPPTFAARTEVRPVEAASLGEKTPRTEKSSIDLSPVREVGF